MRVLVQRVSQARVTVDDETVGEIGAGLVAFVGVTSGDGPEQVARLATKVAHLRVFDDEAGVPNRSVLGIGGQVLVVSQFTLYGDTRKGRRPSYVQAARPEVAEPLIDDFVAALERERVSVQTGTFRAMMQVSLVNDGPMTFWLEAEPGGSTDEG